jgi:hypothetical protein
MEVNCVEMETNNFSECTEEINELGILVGMCRNLDELDHGKHSDTGTRRQFHSTTQYM